MAARPYSSTTGGGFLSEYLALTLHGQYLQLVFEVSTNPVVLPPPPRRGEQARGLWLPGARLNDPNRRR